MCDIIKFIIDNSLVVGIVSGVISSCIVTEIYRGIDKKRDKYIYVQKLYVCAAELYSYLNRPSVGLIDDEKIIEIYDYISKTAFPLKEKWIHFRGKELKEINAFKTFWYKTQKIVFECKFEIDRLDNADTEHQNTIDNDKIKISEIYALESFEKKDSMYKLLGKYMEI